MQRQFRNTVPSRMRMNASVVGFSDLCPISYTQQLYKDVPATRVNIMEISSTGAGSV
jgi:hypothetical protein